MMQGKKTDFVNDICLYEYFEKNVICKPNLMNRKAIIYKNKTFTFSEINSQVIRINNYIGSKIIKTSIGMQPNKIIGIHLNPDEYTISILLAINSLSFSYLPIDPLLPNESMYGLF